MSRSSVVVVLAGLAVSIGCASNPSPATHLTPTASTTSPALGDTAPTDRVFPTIEEAVLDALAAAQQNAARTDRFRYRFGTIRRTPRGYTWSVPVRSRETVRDLGPSWVRLKLGPADVAIYGVHPKSNIEDVDRRNESVSRPERRAIDGQISFRRPLYVLTPSGRIFRYPEAPSTLEVSSRRTTPSR